MAIGEMATEHTATVQKSPTNRFPNLIVIPVNDLIVELQTVIRDKTTTRSDFVFYADRLVCNATNVYISGDSGLNI